MTRRISIEDRQLFSRIGQDITLKSMFAFLPSGLFERLPWLSTLGLELGPRVLPLLTSKVHLPGYALEHQKLEGQTLASVTCDKAIYSPDQRVNLLIFAPFSPGETVDLVLEFAGHIEEVRNTKLDANGMGEAQFSSLRAGPYRAYLQGQDPALAGCSFSVAVYRLVPLVASLVNRAYEDDGFFRFQLHLESFGHPVNGLVRVELENNGKRVAQFECRAEDGRCSGGLQLTGDGPHSIGVQVVSEPEKTATIPIIGSRRSERVPSLFSALGPRILGSLLPSGDCQEARGLYFRQDGSTEAPFEVHSVIDTSVKVVSRVRSLGLVASVIDPFLNTLVTHSLGPTEPGQEVEVPVASALSFVALGAFVESSISQQDVWEPWEGWTATVRPSKLTVELNLPEVVVPGEDLVFQHPDPEGSSFYLLIKDKRLASKETPESRLAGQLKGEVERFQEYLTALSEPVFEAPEPSLSLGVARGQVFEEMTPAPGGLFGDGDLMAGDLFGGGALFDEGADFFGSDGSDPFGVGEPDDDLFRGPSSPALPFGPSVDNLPSAQREKVSPRLDDSAILEEPPQVVFAGIVKGRELKISLPEVSTDFVVEAFLASGSDWTAVDRTVQALQDPQVALLVPPFVHSGDRVQGTAIAQSALGPVEVSLLRDGQEVELDSKGRFQALPGIYQLTAKAGDGSISRARATVQRPGHFKHRVRSLFLLPAGASMSVQGNIVGLNLLPALDQTLRVLVEATAGYGHLCCEQTAAKMLAAMSMYVFSADKRPQAEAIFLSGVNRMKTMVLPGGGFSMYPGGGSLCSYWGPLAVRHLFALQIFQDSALTRPMYQAIDQCLRLATRNAGAHQVQWPPVDPKSASDCYWITRVSSNGKRQAAVERCLSGWREWKEQNQGKVQHRATMAYASATLARAGHLVEALELANAVTADLNEEGRLYSTVDSIAAVTMMTELQAAGVGAGGLRVMADELSLERLSKPQPVRSLRVDQGIAIVEVIRDIESSWERAASDVPLEVEVLPSLPLKVAQSLTLKVSLPQGYVDGDLLWVCLPDCLTRMEGGGQVKLFSLDLEGRSEVSIPLVTTSKTEAEGQHFAICLRNMFEEERIANPGLKRVIVG